MESSLCWHIGGTGWLRYNRAMDHAPEEVTQLLRRVYTGDPAAEEELLNLIYADLRAQAARIMRAERPDHTLEATALVHEAYLRMLRPGPNVAWQDRNHFFALASIEMRRVLVDHARAANAAKRPSKLRKLSLENAIVYTEEVAYELMELNQALDRLAVWDPRGSRVVEMRFFGDLTIEEIASVLGISSRQVKRDWQMARAWLHNQLDQGLDNDAGALATS
jgi:RNA polymerase sigma factor (TIGR02999 family)